MHGRRQGATHRSVDPVRLGRRAGNRPCARLAPPPACRGPENAAPTIDPVCRGALAVPGGVAKTGPMPEPCNRQANYLCGTRMGVAADENRAISVTFRFNRLLMLSFTSRQMGRPSVQLAVSVSPVPNDFVLIVSCDRFKRPCQVVWRSDTRLGVQFQAAQRSASTGYHWSFRVARDGSVI
jgi:hypothetical protein